ncbi:AMOP domain [Desmophyllum pertusum]|uniref:AMOP domain n=1 Tax=Desmophyllum pertusum TaxID=174260 RepID=A0A9X0CRJ7_9CNID|nr:AMOP domain [Desmophyllum pertusum]
MQLPTNTPDEPDPCSIWQNCALHQDVIARRWLQALPSCPCQFGFPSIQHFYNNNTIYDQALNKDFQWRLMNSYVDKRSIPRPTADLCIESLSDSASNSSQSQVCCYNSKPLKLITRGLEQARLCWSP